MSLLHVHVSVSLLFEGLIAPWIGAFVRLLLRVNAKMVAELTEAVEDLFWFGAVRVQTFVQTIVFVELLLLLELIYSKVLCVWYNSFEVYFWWIELTSFQYSNLPKVLDFMVLDNVLYKFWGECLRQGVELDHLNRGWIKYGRLLDALSRLFLFDDILFGEIHIAIYFHLTQRIRAWGLLIFGFGVLVLLYTAGYFVVEAEVRILYLLC